ncbi:MAG TPA: arylamine N-acetyltransferase [Actinophytocola sp.]|jgi:arylamine N-acetyltransferase|nr:arylamine N-acetyltransferase [Actinophytocola sp.]
MTWLPRLDEALRDGYLRRLGLPGPPAPSVETLFALHRAQVELIPYEAVWVWLGERRAVAPLESVRHLVRGRGGYCYQLNGALATLLGWLGFDVRRHVGGVQGTPDDPVGATANHLALTVHGLPCDANPGGEWFIDAGLGDGPHEPMPLVAGAYRQGPFGYELGPSAAVGGGWRFHADPAMSLVGMDFGLEVAGRHAFDAKNAWLQTAPESGFVRVLAVFRRDATGIDALRGRVLRRIADTGTSTDLTTSADWFAALADVFGLPLSDVDTERREALWAKVDAAHEAWLAATQ